MSASVTMFLNNPIPNNSPKHEPNHKPETTRTLRPHCWLVVVSISADAFGLAPKEHALFEVELWLGCGCDCGTLLRLRPQ